MDMHQAMAQLSLSNTTTTTSSLLPQTSLNDPLALYLANGGKELLDEVMTKDEEPQRTIEKLTAHIATTHNRRQIAASQTAALYSSLCSSFNLSSETPAWQTLALEQQIEFGHLETCLNFNTFVLERLEATVESLHDLMAEEDFDFTSIPLEYIEGYLEKAESNIEVVGRKLEDRALIEGTRKMELG